MEWVSWNASSPTNERLQEKVSLIQLACEDKIALFHLGAHPGTKPRDILAPSLRRIIESPAIVKAGSNIMGDFDRLEEFLDLKPRGAIELSHFHNLITYASGSSEEHARRCATKRIGLARQTEEHFGIPLQKGSVKYSGWSRNSLTKAQKEYAASDAYASFMLYYYYESKRAAMDPKPPPLLSAERYSWFNHVPNLGSRILLVKNTDTGAEWDTITVISAEDSLQGHSHKTHSHRFKHIDDLLAIDDEAEQALVDWIPPSDNTPAGNPYQRIVKRWAPKSTSPRTPRKTNSKNPLLSSLKAHREKVARQKGLELYAIASNNALVGIARDRPRSRTELMAVKGVGKKLCDKWGNAWLNMVEKQIETEEKGSDRGSREQRRDVSPTDTSPTTPVRPPALNTELSDAMERSRTVELGSVEDPLVLGDSSDDDDAGSTRYTIEASAQTEGDRATACWTAPWFIQILLR
ncbi:ribonuclease H-like domain-containing protein [Xylariaceae sp. FL0255]|nr:ribonuclease H-like domain-containing protein [Xylariaceae sp. FL0255]